MKSSRWLQWRVLPGLLALLVGASGGALAGTDALAPLRPLDFQDYDNQTNFDVNNLDMFTSNEGSFAYDFGTGNAGLTYPKGTVYTAVFAAGIWMGAKVNGETRVSVAEYSNNYSPGQILGPGSYGDPTDSKYQVYSIETGDNAANNPDYANWPVDQGAPVDAEGNPLLLGDQTLWCVYNDANPQRPHNDAASASGLGVEVQQTTFGFNRTGALGNIVFLNFKIINKGGNTLEDTYISIWSDPDLGQASDDLVGCDTLLSLGYCYNATNSDNQYGSDPPAVGFDFFQGPIVPSEGDTAYVSGRAVPGYRNLPMTSFNKYINGTDPDTPTATYNYMQGLAPDGSEILDESTGLPTRFMVAGDPVRNTGWNDSNPADRRMMLSSGPFTMAPGDTQEVVTALVVGRGKDRLTSVTALKFFDSFAQTAFDVNFNLPSPPPQPEVTATPLDGEVSLYWGDISETSYEEEGYSFEGYNVYMGASIAGPWTRIATYDLVDNVAFIFDDQFDIETGVVINKPVQFGADSGIQRAISIKGDLNGNTLANGRPYYFAVTSYAYGPEQGAGLRTLENAINPIQVIPQSPTAGTALEGVPGDTLEVVRISGTSDGMVAPLLIDPTVTTGDTYRVTFSPNPDTESDVPFVWTLTDMTTGEVVLTDQTNQTPEPDNLITDGFMCNVVGPPLAVKDYTWGPEGVGRWISWVNFGLSGFNGGIGLGYEFFGSTLAPADYSKNVKIEFYQDEGMWSDAPVYRRDLGYAFNGIGTFPGQVFDVTNPDQPRRLNVAFVEDTREKPADQMWNPDDSDLGAREYLFVMNSDYNGGVDYNDDNAAIESDVLIAGGIRTRPGHEFLEADAYLLIENNFINTPADVFEIHTVGPVYSEQAAENRLDRIRVVPNPYFAHSQYEQNQFQRVVKFTNLPAECTIRIFNLAGDLIRTLEKANSTASNMEWNLLTDRNLPVGSGVYIYHVEARDGGRTIGTVYGRMAVFVEKERLNTF